LPFISANILCLSLQEMKGSVKAKHGMTKDRFDQLNFNNALGVNREGK